MKNINPLLLTDAYKLGHVFQYPDNTEIVYSNLTPRKSRLSNIDTTVFFGLQAFVKEYLIKAFNENFFSLDEEEAVNSYQEVVEAMLGKDSLPNYEHIRQLHQLGYLPLRIKALPEGSLVPMKVPALTIVNTKPEFFWLPNFIESLMSAQLWQPCTSATLAFEYKKILTKYANLTSDIPDFVNWQGHDFAFRGMSSLESAALSGSGHLTSFTGTDTVPTIPFFREYYNASVSELIGGSVPATEHSVMCAGTKDDEIETFRRLLRIYPKGILSVVSDTWDLWKVLTNHLYVLKNEILARDGKLVIRPDSGDPVDIICGLEEDQYYIIDGKYYLASDVDELESMPVQYHIREGAKELNPAVVKGVVQLLYECFGGEVNSKGYIQLNSHVGAIYGDSITTDRTLRICQRLAKKGFASTNIVLGIGSYTYQYNTRDTFGWAMKATYVEVEMVADIDMQCQGGPSIGQKFLDRREIFKDPITDDGMKKSAKGLLRVDWDEKENKYVLKDQCTWEEEKGGCLETVFEDGKILKQTTLQEVRERLAAKL